MNPLTAGFFSLESTPPCCVSFPCGANASKNNYTGNFRDLLEFPFLLLPHSNSLAIPKSWHPIRNASKVAGSRQKRHNKYTQAWQSMRTGGKELTNITGCKEPHFFLQGPNARFFNFSQLLAITAFTFKLSFTADAQSKAFLKIAAFAECKTDLAYHQRKDHAVPSDSVLGTKAWIV